MILVDKSWSYNGNVIEIVEQFDYLGFVISTNGSVKKCIDMLAVKARTSMGSLYSSMRGMDIPLDIKLNLCDAYVSPILCYSSEIWGLCDAEVIERVHRCNIKRILNVKRTTTSSAIYGETGRFPLIINRKYVWWNIGKNWITWLPTVNT